ncbi:type II secretion system F family protein [Candidatus Woesearchaeota archaeon]|nr:type II secretion system F family protein [Candidatus Woesearchaeota archaeon]
MRIKFRKVYLLTIGLGLLIIAGDLLLFFSFKDPAGPTNRFFYSILIIGLSIGWVHFWIDFLKELKRQKRLEEKFLDFVRNMKTAVKSGISIPSAIIQAAQKDYSELDPYLKKLSNQIKLGIPIHTAFITFAHDTRNPLIKRIVTIVIEAEESGGEIETVLETVTNSLVSVKKLKEEQKSSTFSQVVQGYIVFFVFIGIMLILQLQLFPKLTAIGGGASGGLAGSPLSTIGVPASGDTVNLDRVFFSLMLIQGLFAGIMIGKFSEGTIKNGLLHSIILMTVGALIITTIKGGI